jgi:hypothetical protein
MLGFLIKIVVIGWLHCVVSVLLYGGMVVNGLPISQPELFVFALLSLIALIVYCAIYWSSGFLRTKPAQIPFEPVAISFANPAPG